MRTGRLEAFSDGVLAVAITLLVLDLHVQVDPEHSLWSQLRSEWPSFAAYGLSFVFIGVIWVNHHALVSLAARVDRRLMFYNLLLLFFVSTIPFTTSTLAAYLRVGGSDSRVAVVLYGVSSEGMAITFRVILQHLLSAHLTRVPVSDVDGRRAVRRFGIGAFVYPVVTAIGFVSAPVMLALYAVVALYYILEKTAILPTDPRPLVTDPAPAD